MKKIKERLSKEKYEKIKIRLTIFLIIFATIFAVITAYQSTQIVLTNIELSSLYAEEGIDEAINEISFENDTSVFIKGNEYNVKFNVNNLDINSTYDIVFYINNKEINKIEYKNTNKIEDTINISEYFTKEGKNNLYIMILQDNNIFKYQRTQTVYYVIPYQEQFLDELTNNGVSTHFGHNTVVDNIDKSIDLIKALGINYIRDDIRWALIEQYKYKNLDKWILKLKENNIKILAILGFPSKGTIGDDWKISSEEELNKYSDYVSDFANRYPFIKDYEVWNEPNKAWTTDENLYWYTRMVKRTKEILTKDEEIKINAGSLMTPAKDTNTQLTAQTFFDKILNIGLNEETGIIMSYHQYDNSYTRKYMKPVEEEIKEILNNHGGFIKSSITEFGVRSYIEGKSEDERCQEIIKQSILVSNITDLNIYYSLREVNDKIDEENYGILNYNYTPKLAYYAMKNYYENTNGAEYIGTINLAEGLETHVYNKDGKPKIITWAKDNTKNITIEYKDFTATDLYGKEIQNQNGTLTITSSPVYLDNIQTSYYNQAISNTALEKYEEFEEKYKTELTNVPTIQANINVQKNYMQNLVNQTQISQETAIQEMQKHYNIGTELIKAVKENKLNIEYVKLSSMLDTLEDIGKSYEDLVTVTAIERNVDIQKAKKQIEETEKLIKNNEKLEIIYPEKILLLSKEYYEKAEYINSLEEENPIKTGLIVSKNIHSELLESWAKDFAKIYIDKYLEEHKPTITYSTTEFINKDVIATINTDIDIQVTNNNGSKTYTFTQNGTFTFKYIINSTEYEITATVNNIDKTMPVISGVENGQTYYIDQNIAPKATDANLKEVKLYLNNVDVNYKNGQIINVEGIYKMIATDKAGNTISTQFQVMKRPESKYELDGKTIKKIKYNTSKEQFDKNIGILKDYKITRKNGKTELKQTDIIASGDILTTSSGVKYTLIVAGDITKDGQVTVDDFTRMRQYLLGLRKLDEVEKLSADANCDGKELSIDDYIRIRILILEQLSWK